jgi:phosphoribosylaminoimidazole-succinocarboxamide synthase
MTPSPLPLLSSGKVRELYDAGDGRLLMVASDRISAFDVIMDEAIPNKGRVLTAMTAAWLDELADLAPNHLISADAADFPEGAATLPGGLEYLAGRSMLVHRAEMLDIECIVRGYLAGSAYKEYQRSGTVHGMAMPAGLLHAQALPPRPVRATTSISGWARLSISWAARRRKPPPICAWPPTPVPPPGPRRRGLSSAIPSSSWGTSTGGCRCATRC